MSLPAKRARSIVLSFERLDTLPRGQVRALDERLEATMREMGVTFDIARERPWGRRPWFCDVLPQIFTPEEWEPLERGISQRLAGLRVISSRHLREEGNSASQSAPDPAGLGQHGLPAGGRQPYAARRRLPAPERTESCAAFRAGNLS